MHTRPTIRSKFRGVTVASALVPVSVLGLALIGVAILGVYRVTVQRQTVIADYAAGHLEAAARGYQQLFGLLGILGALGDMPAETLERNLRSVLSHDRYIDRIIVTDAHGHEHAHVERREDGTATTRGHLWDSSEAFLRPFRHGEAFAGNFYVSPDTGRPLFRVSVPLLDPETNQREGALIAEVVLDVVERALEELPLRRYEAACLLNGEGRVLAAAPGVGVGQGCRDVPPGTGIVRGAEGKISIVAADAVRLADRDYYGVVEQRVFPTHVPLLIVLVTALAAFGYVAVGNGRLNRFVQVQLVHPLEELSDTADALAGGNLDARASHPPLAELSALAEALNTLAENTMRRIEELSHSVEERETLLREVHHRVKNNLQVISSVVRLQADRVTDPVAREVFRATDSRVRSIALVHEQLYQSDSLAKIRFDQYLDWLVRHIIQTHSDMHPDVTVSVSADPAELSVSVAIPCGLIVTEAVTNSLKHAFPPGRSGTVTVRFHAESSGRYGLEIADDGVGGANLTETAGAGIGTMLLHALADQLKADLSVASDTSGTRVRLELDVM